MIKASAGGGGRGMRVVRTAAELPELLERARSEAKKAFGDDRIFLEKLVVRPKHIEVQILGDQHGNLVHLFERDCSVQRRHQKVIEYAPAWSLPTALRARLADDALKIARKVGLQQRRDGRVPGGRGRASHYFIEVNPRIQVEHTVTEAITAATSCRRRSGSLRATSCPTPRWGSPAKPTSSSTVWPSRCG